MALLDADFARPHVERVSRLDGRCRKLRFVSPTLGKPVLDPGDKTPVEESPGSMETRWRLTAAGGDPRESATESKPPRRGNPCAVRVKGCGKSAPRGWQQPWHGKPHREQDQIGAAGSVRQRTTSSPSSGPPPGLVARGAEQSASQMNGRRGGAAHKAGPPDRTRLTGRLTLLIALGNSRSGSRPASGLWWGGPRWPDQVRPWSDW